MNVKEIVKDYLVKNGYGGLYNKSECCCSINRLMDCGVEELVKCRPAYTHIVDDNPAWHCSRVPDKPIKENV